MPTIPEEQKVKPYKDTKKASALETAAASNASTDSKGQRFVVVIRGEYWTRPTQHKPAEPREYQAAFMLNQAQSRIAISYVRAYLLTPKLKEKYPDFYRVYTHHLVALHPLKDPTSYVGIPYHWMGLAQIERLILDQSIPVDPAVIADLHELRALVRTWCENPVDKTKFHMALERAKTNLRRSLKGLEDSELEPEVQDVKDFDEEKALEAAGIGRIKLDANLTI